MNFELRSPIDNVHVRRQAGQGAQAKADALAEETALYIVLPVTIVIVSLILRYSNIYCIFTVLALAIALPIWFYYRHIKNIRHWQLGAMGERYVGQILDRSMPALGYNVYHDLQLVKGKRKMNIDHLLVGPNGVFLIEDKTWSKPLKGTSSVKLDLSRQCVVANGRTFRNPVNEALALAKSANAYFYELTGCSIPVKPVLVFPGWYCEGDNHHDSPLLILNEKALASYLPKHNLSKPFDEKVRAMLTAKLDTVA